MGSGARKLFELGFKTLGMNAAYASWIRYVLHIKLLQIK
jgi:hypothetical protein